MPILVKDYTWTQTNNTIHVKVPVSHVSHENVDIFPSERYIKAHYAPFLLELFLKHEVDIENSKCFVNEEIIVLDLIKKDDIEWDCLEKVLTKEEKMKIRQEVHDQSIEKAKQKSEDKRIKKSQLDRYAVQQAMDIDSKQHSLMDSRRDREREQAMNALEEWRINTEGVPQIMPKLPKESGVIITELPDDESVQKHKEEKVEVTKTVITELPEDEPAQKHEEEEKKLQVPKTITKKVSKPTSKPVPAKTVVKSEFVEKKKKEVEQRVLPKLRQTMELEITHTPRTFPTPSRESTADEEQAWLKNITLARRATGFVSEDLRPEEQDPQWCKDKGDEFFRSGNYLGAISAYTHGIKLSDKLPSLFANRSATHFALGNFNKCINDCSAALDLLKPACEANRRSRAKCIARRAAALARIGYLNKGIDEMKAAAKLLPDDEKIKKDIYDMERAWEQNPDSD